MPDLNTTQKISVSVGGFMLAITVWLGFVSPPPTAEERTRAAAVLLPPERPAAPTTITPPTTVSTSDDTVGSATETTIDDVAAPESTAPSSTSTSPETDEAGILTIASQRQLWLDAFEAGTIDLFGVMTERGLVSEVDRTVSLIEREPDIVQIALGWPHDGLDPGRIAAVTDRGAIPMISWEPWKFRTTQPETQAEYSLQNIINGDYDVYIERFAEGIAELDHPIMIRLAHEMNGNWYPWAEGVNGNEAGSYVLFWRSVVARVEQIAPDHVIWVWSPNVEFRGSTPLERLYPGDDVVDLIGVVGYFGHLEETPTTYPSFEELFGPTLASLEEISDRSVLITETSATEDGGLKAPWTEGLFQAVSTRRDIVGLIWFDVDKEADWRVDSSPEALAAVRAGLDLPSFALTD